MAFLKSTHTQPALDDTGTARQRSRRWSVALVTLLLVLGSCLVATIAQPAAVPEARGRACSDSIAAARNPAAGDPEKVGRMSNGVRLSNGIPLKNGVRLSNGLPVKNGVRLSNGVPLRNGVRLSNGVPIRNGVRLSNGVRAPYGASSGNGVTSWNGLDLADGVQSDARIALVDLRPGALLDCVRGPYFHATPGSRLEQWIATDPPQRKRFLRYLIECALPAGSSVRLKHGDTTEVIGTGVGNLGPSLQSGVMTTADQEKVSSCLLARTNAKGTKVELDLVGRYPGFEKPADPSVFNVREAAYYGNLFASPIEAFVWLPGKVSPRACAFDGDCGVLQPVGTNARLLYHPQWRALDRQGECFVTGTETAGGTDTDELRFGSEKLVPLAYCVNALTGRRYTHVMTVLRMSSSPAAGH